jgi:3-carboxy-cis,cis-muconate cycloisomerase
VTSAFTSAGQLQALLDVEVALAEAQARVGLIPASSVDALRAAADAGLYDEAAIAAGAEAAVNVLIPLLAQVTACVAASSPEAAGHVHYGVTSQDVLDTALVLQLRTALAAIDAALERAAAGAAQFARQHAGTPMAGRTWLQQGTPITFGLKAAGWLDGLERARAGLAAAREDASVVQLGGATGTLSSLGDAGPQVVEALAAQLGLGVPDLPWHAQRDRIARVGCALGIACGAMGKVARDVVLLGQSEVGEVAEHAAEGRGGSSSMPHKRNPVGSVRVLAAAAQAPGLVATLLAAMPQEHERAAGGWQAEWEALPALVTCTARAAESLAGVVAGLQVDAARMRQNLDLQGGVARAEGLSSALAPHVGRVDAMRLAAAAVERALATGGRLDAVAAADPAIARVLGPEEVARALDPSAFAGASRTWIDQVLQRWRR